MIDFKVDHIVSKVSYLTLLQIKPYNFISFKLKFKNSNI